MGLVKEFAKKTGDIASLSQIDMELIAVAFKMYQ
jgi:rRNA maturation endonuclease Nob1